MDFKVGNISSNERKKRQNDGCFYRPCYLATLLALTLISVSIFSISPLSTKLIAAEAEQASITKIRIATNNDDAPFSFVLPNGKLTGLYVDIWREWSIHTGIEIEFSPMSHNNSILSLINGDADLVAGLFKNSKRSAWANFSLPIAQVKSKLFFNSDGQSFPEITQLLGKTIAVGDNTFQSDYMKSKYPSIKLVPFTDFAYIVEQLQQNKVDALLVEERALQSYLDQNGLKWSVVPSAPTILTNLVHGMMLKSRTALLSLVNDGFSTISLQQLNKVEKKWVSDADSIFHEQHRTLATLTIGQENWLVSHNNFSLGVSPELIPFEWITDEGEHLGISADYIKLVKNYLSVEMNHKNDLSWVEVLDKLKSKEIDILPAVVRTQSREAYINFTQPYLSFPLVIASVKGFGFIQGLGDLNKKIVAVEKSTPAEEILANSFPNIELWPVNSVAEGMRLLNDKKVDAYVHNLGVLTHQINSGNYPNVVIAAYTPFTLEFSMGVRKGLEPLVPILNKALANISEKERRSINNSWLAVQVNLGTNLTTIMLWSVPLISFLILIIYWMRHTNRRLAAEVATRVSAEQGLVEAKLKAEKANLAKNNFLANMSHEIRTPMNAIIGLSQILTDSDLNEEQTKHNDMLNSSASMLLALLNDILDLSKVEAEKLTLELINVELAVLVDRVVSPLKLLIINKDILLTINIADDVPCCFLADPLRISQILTNLINNAMKFTERGEIVVEITKINETETSEKESSEKESSEIEKRVELKFTVTDSGIGMSSAQIEKLFSTYNQADSSTTRKYGGTGLGLAISKKLCELMDGKIWVTSEEGKGSKFNFTAVFKSPTYENTCVSAENTLSEISSDLSNVKKIEYPDLAGKHILLVDDNHVNMIVAAAHLKKAGIIVTQAENGQIAVDKVKQQSFDAILMDIQMPVMDGYDATKIIRSELGLVDIPIIAVSANVMTDDAEKSLKAGMNEHLGKPLNVDLLFKTLTKFI